MENFLRTNNKINFKRLNYSPVGLIMGKAGVGKSTLINKITGANHISGSASSGVTKNLHKNQTNCGDHSFYVIDTPGTNSKKDTFKHAFLLRIALTAVQLNTIFIVIKFDPRYEMMLESFFEELNPVEKFSEKVVLIISCWDQSEKKDKDFVEICKEFEGSCSKLIFYSNHSVEPISSLANLMYAYMSNMTRQTLVISMEEFLLKFNISTVPVKMEMFRSFKDYEGQAKKMSKDYEEMLSPKVISSVPASDRDEFLHGLLTEFRHEMENNLEVFRKKYETQLIELDFWCFDIKMQKDILKRCEAFNERIKPFSIC